jgi:hypothetical protein
MGETFYVRKIIEYFKKNLKKGYTPESLKWALISQGYPRVSVDKALEFANQELAKAAPLLREKPVIRYEVIDSEGKPVELKKSFWRRLLGL